MQEGKQTRMSAVCQTVGMGRLDMTTPRCSADLRKKIEYIISAMPPYPTVAERKCGGTAKNNHKLYICENCGHKVRSAKALDALHRCNADSVGPFRLAEVLRG